MDTKFKDLKSTKIGTIAEEFVDDYLISQGYQTWFNTNKQSTPWDGFANNNKKEDKWKKILVEVKCKTKTAYGDFGIHHNDLQIYKKAEKEENRPMLIFYVDYISKKLYLITTSMIEEHIKDKKPDQEDGKSIIYFNGFKPIADIPQNIIDKILKIKSS